MDQYCLLWEEAWAALHLAVMDCCKKLGGLQESA